MSEPNSEPKQTDRDKKPISRRTLLKFAVAGGMALTGLYTLDRSNLLVNIVKDINPLHMESQPLKPESGEAGNQLNIPWLPKTVSRWEKLIEEMANRYEIDPNLIAIIMTIESGGYSRAESAAPAQGLMQITPPTASDIAQKYLKTPVDNYDIWDPRTNVEFGTAYLYYVADTFGVTEHGPTWNNTVELVAAGYNGGPGSASNLLKGKGLRSIETLSYSRDAINMWRERHAETSPTYERWYERGGHILIEKALNEEMPSY